MKITLSAPAKINLTLAITGIREDGYHLLESIMQAISLSDTVTVEDIPSGILISCSKSGIPLDEKNLCHKAAKRYLEEAGISGGVKIHLIKCIPDGAGMGGGSSDAAAVLKAMQTLYPAEVDLVSIAASVGADVPFFLTGGTCLCQGVGEVTTSLSLPGKENLFCVVGKPCEGLSTPRIYKLYDDSHIPFSPSLAPKDIEEMERMGVQNIFPRMQNDLELPAIALLPEIASFKAALLEQGAEGAMMTGSGSAVFGLFPSEPQARKCAEAFKKSGKEAYFCTLL